MKWTKISYSFERLIRKNHKRANLLWMLFVVSIVSVLDVANAQGNHRASSAISGEEFIRNGIIAKDGNKALITIALANDNATKPRIKLFSDGNKHPDEEESYISVDKARRSMFAMNGDAYTKDWDLVFLPGNPIFTNTAKSFRLTIPTGSSFSIQYQEGTPILHLISNEHQRAWSIYPDGWLSLQFNRYSSFSYSDKVTGPASTISPLEIRWVDEQNNPTELRLENWNLGKRGTYTGIKVKETGDVVLITKDDGEFLIFEAANEQILESEFPLIDIEGFVSEDTIAKSVALLRALREKQPYLIEEIKKIKWRTNSKVINNESGHVAEWSPGAIHMSYYTNGWHGIKDYMLTFVHETAHVHTFSIGGAFRKEWKLLTGEKYGSLSHETNGSYAWNDGIKTEMRFCFASPYGARNIFEDIAEFTEAVWKYPKMSDWKDAFHDQDYADCYRSKLRLLEKYKFITPGHLQEVLGS